ncbi:hypothetical protein Tco_0693956 [Tanacetum coccineum]
MTIGVLSLSNLNFKQSYESKKTNYLTGTEASASTVLFSLLVQSFKESSSTSIPTLESSKKETNIVQLGIVNQAVAPRKNVELLVPLCKVGHEHANSKRETGKEANHAMMMSSLILSLLPASYLGWVVASDVGLQLGEMIASALLVLRRLGSIFTSVYIAVQKLKKVFGKASVQFG